MLVRLQLGGAAEPVLLLVYCSKAAPKKRARAADAAATAAAAPARRTGRQRAAVNYADPPMAEVLAAAPAAKVSIWGSLAVCFTALCSFCWLGWGLPACPPCPPCRRLPFSSLPPPLQEREALPAYSPPSTCVLRLPPAFDASQGQRDGQGRLVFADHSEFRPNLTPKQVIQAGSFGG